MHYKIFLILFTILSIASIISAEVYLHGPGRYMSGDLSKQKEIILGEEQSLAVNGNHYYAEKGSKFVFNEKGELAEGTRFTTRAHPLGKTYNLRGVEVALPKGTEVIYEKNKIIVQSKEELKLSVKGKGEALIEFRSEKGIELENGLKIQGLLTNGKREETNIFFDGTKNLFYMRKGELNGLEIGRLNSPDAYLFSNEIPKGFDKPAILIKDNKVLLKGTSTEESSDLTYKKNDAKLITQALKGGEMELTFGSERIDIVAKGKYNVVNGEFIEKNGKIFKISEKGRKILNPSEKGIPLHIINYKENGEKNVGETFYNIDGKDFFIGRSGRDGVYTKDNGEVYIDNKELRVSLDNLNQEQTSKYQELSREDKLKLLQGVARGENLGEVLGSIRSLPSSNVKVSRASGYARYDNNPTWQEAGDDISTNIHETIHLDINAPLSKGEYRAFYLGNGEYSLVKETGDTKSKVVKYVPTSIVDAGRFNNYFGPMFTSRDATHVFEDLSAFQGGARAAFNQAKSGKSFSGLQDDVSAIADFNVFSLALGLQVKNENKDYWESNEGTQFRGYLRRSLEDGTKLLNEAYTDNRLSQFRWEGITDNNGNEISVQKRINSLRTSEDKKINDLRNFAKETYGEAWTKKYLGF